VRYTAAIPTILTSIAAVYSGKCILHNLLYVIYSGGRNSQGKVLIYMGDLVEYPGAVGKKLAKLDQSTPNGRVMVDALVAFVDFAGADKHAFDRVLEFFTAQIPNQNTRAAYCRAVRDFFTWCIEIELDGLVDIEPVHIAAYIEQLGKSKSAPTCKQNLAALRSLFDWLVVGQVIATNPASTVRGPKHSQLKGKTPILTAEDARKLLESIPTNTLVGLRDRALIGMMIYSFARVSAALSLTPKDVFRQKRRLWIRLNEKGGKVHDMPCHHNLELYLLEYMEAAGFDRDGSTPLFPTIDRQTKTLSDRALHRVECFQMVRRRARKAELETDGIGNHTFRGTGITAYLSNPDARLELAQQMAAHSDPKTTRMYDRRSDDVSLDEVEKIGI